MAKIAAQQNEKGVPKCVRRTFNQENISGHDARCWAALGRSMREPNTPIDGIWPQPTQVVEAGIAKALPANQWQACANRPCEQGGTTLPNYGQQAQLKFHEEMADEAKQRADQLTKVIQKLTEDRVSSQAYSGSDDDHALHAQRYSSSVSGHSSSSYDEDWWRAWTGDEHVKKQARDNKNNSPRQRYEYDRELRPCSEGGGWQ
jgi:hypothetical protein